MKLLKLLLALVLFLAVLAGVLFWTAPAELAHRYYADRLGPVAMQGLSGSVWDGRAERVSAFAMPLGAAHWRVDRWSALRGATNAKIEIDGSEIDGSATVLAREGTTRVEQLRAKFPARLLAPALDIPALLLLGTVELDFEHLELVDGLPREIAGRATWRELGVSGGAEARLPGLELVFAPGADGRSIVVDVRDLGGALAISGRSEIRGARYVSETRLSLREPNPQLEEALKWVGERTPDGATLLRIEGEIHPL